MKKSFIFIPIFFLLTSCYFSNGRILKVENQDLVSRTIKVTLSSGNVKLEEIKPSESVIMSIDGPYSVKITEPARAQLKARPETKSKLTYTDMIIVPVNPVSETYTILNLLNCDITLKDTTYPEWYVSVSQNSSSTKTAQLYSDQTHNFYIDGGLIENGFKYVEISGIKYWYELEIDGYTIKIKQP